MKVSPMTLLSEEKVREMLFVAKIYIDRGMKTREEVEASFEEIGLGTLLKRYLNGESSLEECIHFFRTVKPVVTECLNLSGDSQ